MPTASTPSGLARATSLLATLLLVAMLAPAGVRADTPSPVLTIDGAGFSPPTVALPPGQKIKLTIRNRGPLPAEFESYDLSREVIVPAGGEVEVYIGPLEAGRYGFFNDFNPSMKGAVIVKPTDATGSR